MLRELTVENLLLIERASLRAGPGLNVITGETGAGKTVLAHALDLLLGGRARAGIVRPGAQEAYVEGIFDLPEELRSRLPAELAERLDGGEREIVLARRLGADGRTRAYVNGRAANVSDLRDAGGLLLSFYGQHEHRKLTVAGAQLQILDALCGPVHERRLASCAQTHARARELDERLVELRELAAHRERELGLLEFELGEIDQLAPDAAEQQLERARQHALARAGLPREHVQAWRQPQLGALDQEQVLDVQLEQHRAVFSNGRGRTFAERADPPPSSLAERLECRRWARRRGCGHCEREQA